MKIRDFKSDPNLSRAKFTYAGLQTFLAPLVYLSAVILKAIRRRVIHAGSSMKVSKSILAKVGVYPILDHFYEPLFNYGDIARELNTNRSVPGIDFNVSEQLGLLSKFHFNEELVKIPIEKKDEHSFYYHNGSFEVESSEFYYSMIRLFKPQKIVEIGSGNSTKMALTAIRQNEVEDPEYCCEITSIDPYHAGDLGRYAIRVVPEKVERVPKSLFKTLERNDILFIDSSHIIRPRGDVVFEYLEALPILNDEVQVHIHDIFTPRDYLEELSVSTTRFWNEQYLLEAFLSLNCSFKIVAMLNYLKHNHFEQLAKKCPILKKEPSAELSSLWIIKSV